MRPASPAPTRPATSRAACGGQIDTITSARAARSATVGTACRSASSARLAVACERPASAQITAPARALSADPSAAPIAPGCRTPTTGRAGRDTGCADGDDMG